MSEKDTYMWPTSEKKVSTGFNEYNCANWAATGCKHTGVDFPVPIGTSVVAMADGKVTKVQHLLGSYGNFVEIEHKGQIKSLYAHLSETSVKVGQEVDRGQVVGLSGNSGNSKGPHLHFEVRQMQIPQNPLSYLNAHHTVEEADGPILNPNIDKLNPANWGKMIVDWAVGWGKRIAGFGLGLQLVVLGAIVLIFGNLLRSDTVRQGVKLAVTRGRAAMAKKAGAASAAA